MSVSEGDAVLAGRYRLESKIAVGGMGEVWRGEDTVLGRPVAIKLMRAEFAGDAETLIRFRAEARHSAALSHSGIAHVYDYGEDGPKRSPFIVMELVDGPSLTEVLAHGSLQPGRVMDIVAQAATALAAAHAAGLVHRDIKPGNILIARGGVVKITDFGIAYAAGSAPLTRTGALMGTPAYLAPERISGSPGSPACDLYALGMVAYECLAGGLPFSGTPVQVTLAYARQALPPLPASVPGPVAGLVAQLTAKDPAARPARAADVAARARRLRDSLPFAPLPFAPAQADRPQAAALPPGAHPDMEPRTEHSGATLEPAAVWAGPPAGAMVDTQPPTIIDRMPAAAQPARGRARRSRHPVLLAASVIAVAAALGGWLVARDVISATPTPGSGASSHSSGQQAPKPTVPVVNTVDVNGPGLVGLPVQQAVQQVRQLGLTVQVVLVPSLLHKAGTVLDVQPSGQVPQGTTVVLDTAVSPFHSRHHDSGSGSAGSGGGDPGDGQG